MPFAPGHQWRWKPGQAVNPGGKSRETAEALRMAQKCTPKMMRALIKIALNEDAKDSDRLTAIKEVLDRGLGKAVQAVAAPDGGPPRIVIETHVINHNAPAEVERRALKIIEVVAEPSEDKG